MTERWRRELGLLDRVDPSPELLDRARQGPRLPLPPPRSSRRILAAAVALLVAAGGTVGAFAALHGRESTTPVEHGRTSFLGLWPEDLLPDAQQVQQQVDAGDPSVQWRLDPKSTAKQFAVQVLGWTDAIVNPAEQGGGAAAVYDLSTVPPSCPATEGCPPWTLVRRVRVTLQQAFRSGPTGIWSVTGVEGVKFFGSGNGYDAVVGQPRLPLEPGKDVASDYEVVVQLPVPSEGEQVLAGYAYECGSTITFSSDVQQLDDGIGFSVGNAAILGDCSAPSGEPTGEPSPVASPLPSGPLDRPVEGYVFVAVVHASTPGQPWAPLTMPPPAGMTVVSLAVVPVHFVPSP